MVFRNLVLLFTVIALGYGATAEHDALNILLQNQDIIQNKLNLTKPHDANKQEFNMEEIMRDSMSSLFALIQKPYSDKESIEYITVYKRFFSFIVSGINGTSEISDSINIRVLSNLLRSGNSDWAIDKLINRTTFNALKINSPYIKNNLNNSNLIGYRKYSLLRLLVINEKEKDSILAYPGLNLFEKASVSDSLLDSLISLYKKDKNTDLKITYAGHLMKTGKKAAVKAALEDFCASVYHIDKFKTEPPCTSNYLQGVIFINLWRYNADAPEYHFSDDFGNNPSILGKRIAFWTLFKKWVFKNYNVNLQDSMPQAFLKNCNRRSYSR